MTDQETAETLKLRKQQLIHQNSPPQSIAIDPTTEETAGLHLRSSEDPDPEAHRAAPRLRGGGGPKQGAAELSPGWRMPSGVTKGLRMGYPAGLRRSLRFMLGV